MAARKTPAKKPGKKSAARSAPRSSTSGRAQSRGLPDVLYANASPRSVGGTSMFESLRSVTADDAIAFASEESTTREAVNRLQLAGFQVLGISTQTINIAGPPELYEEVFGTQLIVEDRDVIKPGQVEDVAQFVECPDTDIPGLIETRGTEFQGVLEGVAIEEPVYFMAASAFAPTKEYWHLRVPGDVAAATNAERAHRLGYTGKGVEVVMVDSGWFRHPYFVRRGYRSSPVVLGPAASNPNADESGHGTGESANLFAVAPDINFTMVKINFVNSLGAFNAGIALGPDIISNSWGSSQRNPPLSAANQALGAAVALAWSNGVVVVFSAGNGHWGFPGQHPNLISAGGVFMDEDESLRASDYASGFASNIYVGRNTPDLSGLVGMRPGASYIMLPVEPGDGIDSSRAGGSHPPDDETDPNDGWSAFSGTSAAAPQLAGVAALMKQACGRISPTQIRSMMMTTATDVTQGNNHPNFNNPAGPGYDLATGAGLVDANRAVLRARLACLTVRPPIGPIGPIRPPIGRIRPPVGPIRPPIGPIGPIRPPIGPVGPTPPVVRGSHDGGLGVGFEAQLREAVDAMVRSGYSDDEINTWLSSVVEDANEGGLSSDEAAALEQAILAGDDFDL